MDKAAAEMAEDETWRNWMRFRDMQKEVILKASEVAHIDVKIRYIDLGPSSTDGETILLMHGIPTWGFLYHEIIPRLLKHGYRVVAPDFLGHGFSDKRDRFDRSFQDQARVILALLKNIGLDKVHVVGHDTGGAVALILAIEHAHVVDRLVITNSVCYDRFDDDMLDFGHPLRWKPRPLEDLVIALEETIRLGLTRANERLTTSFREGIIAPWNSEEGKLSLLRNASALNANQTMALVDRHGTITARKMILWGMDDPWQKAEDGQRLASEIPHAIFRPIHNASHWVQHDAPNEFTAALLDHLSAPST